MLLLSLYIAYEIKLNLLKSTSEYSFSAVKPTKKPRDTKFCANSFELLFCSKRPIIRDGATFARGLSSDIPSLGNYIV